MGDKRVLIFKQSSLSFFSYYKKELIYYKKEFVGHRAQRGRFESLDLLQPQ